jgi:hypothetical protein
MGAKWAKWKIEAYCADLTRRMFKAWATAAKTAKDTAARIRNTPPHAMKKDDLVTALEIELKIGKDEAMKYPCKRLQALLQMHRTEARRICIRSDPTSPEIQLPRGLKRANKEKLCEWMTGRGLEWRQSRRPHLSLTRAEMIEAICSHHQPQRAPSQPPHPLHAHLEELAQGSLRDVPTAQQVLPYMTIAEKTETVEIMQRAGAAHVIDLYGHRHPEHLRRHQDVEPIAPKAEMLEREEEALWEQQNDHWLTQYPSSSRSGAIHI